MDNNITLNVTDEKSEFYDLDLFKQSFYDEKEKIKFIKNVERIIRSSIEYKDWVKYIKEVKGWDHCLFTGEKNSEVTIEIHHHPFTLYDIVSIVLETYISQEKFFNTYSIAQETMKLHYTDKVGYVPLVKTLHEKYHNGFLHIPLSLVHGDWNYLYSSRMFTIPETIFEKISIEINNSKSIQDSYINNYRKWYKEILDEEEDK